ncbi:MAG: hypothetical protein QXE84_08010, partial [Candidatus Nitrosotenuis sp.]
MNNEIGRKITSLTLMTIMLAAGFTAFAPSVMPQAAAANANLFVSAENSQFQNYFGGPMVIEVVVIDSDIKDTTQGKGEPDVTVNGNKLRMVQATDGNWYGYFADRAQAQLADSLVTANGTSLDFGNFCSAGSAQTILGIAFTQTVGVAIATNASGATNGQTTPGTCTSISATGSLDLNNVVRENKTINRGGGANAISIGQVGLTALGAAKAWPFIQLYNFNQGGNVVVQYNKGGGVQTTTLKFDTADQFSKIDLDRAVYPRSAQVHVTITEVHFNIDPTDEDSWTFQTIPSNTTTHYQVFDENGAQAGDQFAGGVPDIGPSLGDLMIEEGVLKLTTNTQGSVVVTIQDNGDTQITGTSAANARTPGSSTHGRLVAGTQPITITESGPNTGIFGTYDESDVSTLAITSNAARGQSATIDYSTAKTILVGFGFASIDIRPNDVEWNSGEEIPVVLTDSDANKNSRADEDLDFNNPAVSLIPALSTGDPFTLGEAGVETVTYSVAFTNTTSGFGASGLVNLQGLVATHATIQHGVGTNMTVQKFSERGLINNLSNTTKTVVQGNATIIDLKTTAAELYRSIKDPRGSSN